MDSISDAFFSGLINIKMKVFKTLFKIIGLFVFIGLVLYFFKDTILRFLDVHDNKDKKASEAEAE